MSWGKEQIDRVAVQSADADYEAFEAIGLESIENASVLDVGCFDGFNTVLKFAPYENISRVIGIDPETERLKEAHNQTSDERFTWLEATAEDFDGPDDSFDLIYFSHVFQHTKDKELAAHNAFRMLKPGGRIIIKTFDDSCKISYPDPDNVMRRLFDLYEEEILPRTPHTRYTDRNNGHKCPTYLQKAGFENIRVTIHNTDTLNKSLEERLALFKRFTYFRKNTPEGVSDAVAQEQRELLQAWEDLFRTEGYYHASNTFVIIAQKPKATSNEANNSTDSSKRTLPGSTVRSVKLPGGVTISPMCESDLGKVMSIEVNAFPDPWAPIAYAMELRHNPAARYVVASDKAERILGFVGWWETQQGIATIMHIAVDTSLRRSGIGTALLSYACQEAAAAGCSIMTLQVRAKNSTARSFYKHCGFDEVAISEGYYTSPDDDAVAMQKSIKD